MANTTINGLAEITSPSATDEFVVWSTTSNGTRKVNGQNLDKLVFRSRSAPTVTDGKSLPLISYAGGVPVVENLSYTTVVNDVATKVGQSTVAPHTHDDRYYTETEVNTLLAGKVTNGGSVTSIQRVTAMPSSPNANTLYIVIP